MKSEVPYARDIWKNVGGMMGGIDGKQARKIMQDGKVFGKALDERFGRRKQSYPWEQTLRAITDDDDDLKKKNK